MACKLPVTSLVLKNLINTMTFLLHMHIFSPPPLDLDSTSGLCTGNCCTAGLISASLVLTNLLTVHHSLAWISTFQGHNSPTAQPSRLSPPTPCESLNVIHYTIGPVAAPPSCCPSPLLSSHHTSSHNHKVTSTKGIATLFATSIRHSKRDKHVNEIVFLTLGLFCPVTLMSI